jgi:serine/threonine-protein kinase RsbW
MTALAAGDDGRALALDFLATPLAVRRALRRVGDLTAEAGLAQGLCEDAQIVLGEVLNNVVEHAYADGAGPVRLVIRADGGALDCEVADEGRPMPDGAFPAAGRSGPEPAGLPEGGFGWFLIRQLTCRLDYASTGGQNRLRFRIAGPSAQTGQCAGPGDLVSGGGTLP